MELEPKGRRRKGAGAVKNRWISAGVLAAMLMALTLVLSGCFFRSPEELYQSPERSADYENLTQKIREVKGKLAQEYGVTEVEDTSVLSGDNTALIQLQDMDGDGQRETAVTFFRVPGAEKPQKIFFFTKGEDDIYTVSAMLEGDGSAIYRVDYADLDGSGYKEVVVSWQMSTGAYLLGVYSVEAPMSRSRLQMANSSKNGAASVQNDDLRGSEWMTTAYGDYILTDIDQDSRTEVAIVRIDPSLTNSGVDVYGWKDSAFKKLSTAPLSTGVVSVSRGGVEENFINGDPPVRALYVSSELSDGSHVVDVIAYQQGKLTNISLAPETGISRETLSRYVDLEPSDVNGDGVLELPQPSPLPGQEDSTASDYWLIDWYQYDSSGQRIEVCTTYHNMTDGWYLIIPDTWKDCITISRYDAISGQRAVIFYHLEGSGDPSPFLVIYKFTSQTNRANTSNRFILREEENAVYAASFYNSSWDCGMDETELVSAFKLIQSGWSD